MWKIVLVGAACFAAAPALACPGKSATAHAEGHSATHAHAQAHGAQKDPAACAKKAELVGNSCSYSTGMMAQRVLTEGRAWSFAGRINATDTPLASRVAAPYSVGPDQAIRVVANQVLEELTSAGGADDRVSLDGKVLEVDGVTYFVVTGFRTLNS